MKKTGHPKYMDCTIKCGCGESWQTRATVPEMRIEVCGSCHPFYTGRGDRYVDALGRVDRFTKKFGGEYFKQQTKKDRTKRR